MPASIASGAEVSLSWTVANHGNAPASGGWVDRLILSADATIGNADDIILGSVVHNDDLAIGANYTATATVRIPTRLVGTYPHRTDQRRQPQRARTGHARRTTYACPARSASCRPTPTSCPTLTTVPAEVFAGGTARIEWNVRNDGTITTDVNRWTDRLYLSNTPTLSADALLLGSLTHVGTLGVGEAYDNGMDVSIPRTPLPLALCTSSSKPTPLPRPTSWTTPTTTSPQPPAPLKSRPSSTPTSSSKSSPRLENGARVSAVTVTYTLRNIGDKAIDAYTGEQLRLVDASGINAARVLTPRIPSDTSLWGRRTLAAGECLPRSFDFTVPALPDGDLAARSHGRPRRLPRRIG